MKKSPEPENYRYYCSYAKGHYPYVKECPSSWTQLVPSPGSPEED